MTEDDAFRWDSDTKLLLPENVQIRVLQRAVHDPSALAIDLQPFEAMPAFWAIEGERTYTGEATVLGYGYDGSDDYYSVSFSREGKVDAAVRHVKNRQLIVWRWANELNVIQLRVRGDNYFTYAQVGGARTVPALAMFERSRIHDPVVTRATNLYRTGELVNDHESP